MKWFAWLLAGVIVVFSCLYWWTQRPIYYSLNVINKSKVVVDQVSVFGAGITASIENLLPNSSQPIILKLEGDGELRVEVRIGLNKVDHLIVKDIRSLKHYRQQLSINPENHYIFSNQE